MAIIHAHWCRRRLTPFSVYFQGFGYATVRLEDHRAQIIRHPFRHGYVRIVKRKVGARTIFVESSKGRPTEDLMQKALDGLGRP